MDELVLSSASCYHVMCVRFCVRKGQEKKHALGVRKPLRQLQDISRPRERLFKGGGKINGVLFLAPVAGFKKNWRLKSARFGKNLWGLKA